MESFDFAPVSPAEARRVAVALRTARTTDPEFVDAHHRVHVARDAIRIRGQGVPEQVLTSFVADSCASDATCAITSTGKYELDFETRVPDGIKILEWTAGIALGSALVAGNIACFGTNVCSDLTTAVVGVSDGIVGVAALVSLVAVVVVLANLPHGD